MAVLVVLVAAQEAVFGTALLERPPNALDLEQEANGLAVPRGVAAALIREVGVLEEEAVLQPDGPTVDLQQQQAQPAALERDRGELALERLVLPAEQTAGVSAEACAVEAERGIEIALERRGRCVPVLDRSVAFEAVPAKAHALAEFRALPPEELGPRVALKIENGIARRSNDATAEHARPVAIAGDPVTDEDVVWLGR